MKTRKFLAFAIGAAMLGMGMSCSSDDDGPNQPEPEPNYDQIVGSWKSPVPAPILASFVDSLEVDFRNNQTYEVRSYKDGAVTLLKGTYETSDGVGSIRNILLHQSEPTSLSSQGIYQISSNDGEMNYEVAQIEPEQAGVTPPTPQGGFGSTSGGAFGDMNIQHYFRVN